MNNISPSERAWKQLAYMTEIDLMDFNNKNLDQSGELTISSNFSNPIYLMTGPDLLELSKVPDLPINENDHLSAQPDVQKNAYLVRNLNDTTPEDAILFDANKRGLNPANVAVRGLGKFTLKIGRPTQPTGPSLVIGRGSDATPELQLSSAVSREHARLRIGFLGRALHIMDLESTNGTKVYIHNDDARYLDTPTRIFDSNSLSEDIVMKEAVDRRWNRKV
jgi:hypothetical protein